MERMLGAPAPTRVDRQVDMIGVGLALAGVLDEVAKRRLATNDGVGRRLPAPFLQHEGGDRLRVVDQARSSATTPDTSVRIQLGGVADHFAAP